MTMDATLPNAQQSDITAIARRLITRKRQGAILILALLLAYLVYVFFAFDIPGLAQRARLDNAQTLVRDSYSYKTQVTISNRTGDMDVSIEGERKGTFTPDQYPDWVRVAKTRDGLTRVDLTGGTLAEISKNRARITVPGYGTIDARIAHHHIQASMPAGPVPDWISKSGTRLAVKAPNGSRINMTPSKIEVFRYFLGWEMFFFTVDSPFYGKSPGELLSLALSSDRVDPARPNWQAMLHAFWFNGVWRHNEVAWAIFETVLMAFVGTMSAALIALPIAFLSARNFTPSLGLRFGFRRVLDFLRGVDALIWTIVLSRAFGPGPLTGSLAILLTDTGSFGKIFSEALENVDDKQIEGVRSTGANPVQRYRFGVIPQVMPVLLSQVLYFLESNTRSATIIGAIVGGGIGLLLTQAIITQRDWEEVSYYIVLILLMVMAMDWLSGWLRRRLIKSNDSGI